MIQFLPIIGIVCLLLTACGGEKTLPDGPIPGSSSSSSNSSTSSSNSSSGHPSLGGDFWLGQEQYEQYCQVCHGTNGEGNPQLNAPTLVKCSICDKPTVLQRYIDQEMPPGGASAAKLCAGDCALNVTTFVLEAFNGRKDRAACSSDVIPGASSFKRLSRLEYANTLKELLQLPNTPNVAAVPDDPSVYNFKTMASVQSVQVSHLNGYLNVATEQAEALMAAADRRSKVVGCDINSQGCFDQFLTNFGRLAYRRPLTQEEIGRIRQYVVGNAQSTQDQYILALQIFLTSPNFIYRVEVGNSPEGLSTLDDYELISRLAFALWGRSPNKALLDRAERGELKSAQGLRDVAESMLADPRARENMQHFFEQWLSTNLIEAPAEKPQGWYDGILDDMRAETNTLLSEYVWEGKDFMKIFTENRTYMTPSLASYYGLPRPNSTDQAVNLPPNHPRSHAGILTHASNLFSKGDGDLIAKRGNWLRSAFLCKELQLPSNIADVINGKFAGYTALEILTERNRDPACERCHAQIDPIGVAFAQFDRAGRYDHSIDLGDYPVAPGFPDGHGNAATIQDIARQLSEMPEVSECIADRLFLYMRNHVPEENDTCAVYNTSDRFAHSGHQFASMLLAMVEDPSFRVRLAPEPDDSITPPPPPIVNLALGKSVTTSSAQDGNPGLRLTDNDLNGSSRWSAQTYPQRATIDLGSVRNIVQIEAYPYEDRAYRYTIEISRDGFNYTRLVDRSHNTQGGNAITDLFAPTSARYVRIIVTGAFGYTGDWIAFREIKILGPSD